MMHKKPSGSQRAFICLAVILAWAGIPVTVLAQTLEQALVSAYRNNPTLLAARARLRATDEGVNQALSDWRPTISAEGDAGATVAYSNTATNRHQRRDPVSWTLSVDQSVYKGGQTTAATRQAENEVRAERGRLAASERDVLLAAATAFMDVVRDQAVLELNVNNEQVLRRQLEATRDRYEVGEITRTDVHQAEARLAGATADRIKGEGDLETSRAAYRNVIGASPEKLNHPELPPVGPKALGEAIEAALAENPELVAAGFDARAGLDNVDEIKGELLPSVDLSGSAGRAFDATSETSRADSYTAKLTLTVPLYQSGSVYSRLREARQEAAELRRKTDQSQRDAVEATTRAWKDLQTTRARIDSFKTQIKAAETALEGVQREASVGSRTVLDVLDAEQELLDARVSFVGAQRDEVIAVFALKGAMGRLTAEKINLPVDLYDSRGHYREVRDKWTGGTSSGDVTEKGDSGTPVKP